MTEVYGIVLRNRGGLLCAALFCFTTDSKVLLMQRALFVSTSSPSLRALGAIGRSLAALPDFTFAIVVIDLPLRYYTTTISTWQNHRKYQHK
jgi:hypothetical protein